MKVYYFSDTDWKRRLNVTRSEMTEVMTKVARDTNTDELVIAMYLTGEKSGSGGVALVQNWLTHKQFISPRGRWRFTRNFPIPNDLPSKYKLIRLQFGVNNIKYPSHQQDRYGWELSYQCFLDHLAFLFAHELHHFRRYHLGLHRREGENSANKWAIHRVQELKFQVSGIKLATKTKKKKFTQLLRWQLGFDPYKKFRHLRSGDKLIIGYDPKGRYQNEQAFVVRPVRKNSRRIVIKTSDGKSWRWPMEWVELLN